MSTVNVSIKDVQKACGLGIKNLQVEIDKHKTEIDRLYEEAVQAYMTRRFFKAKNRDQAVKWLEKRLAGGIFNEVAGVWFHKWSIKDLNESIIKANSLLHACDIAADDQLSLSIEDANKIKKWLDLENVQGN